MGGGSEMKRRGQHPNASLTLTRPPSDTLSTVRAECASDKVTGWFWDNSGGVGGGGFRLPCTSALFSLLMSPREGGGKRNVCDIPL